MSLYYYSQLLQSDGSAAVLGAVEEEGGACAKSRGHQRQGRYGCSAAKSEGGRARYAMDCGILRPPFYWNVRILCWLVATDCIESSTRQVCKGPARVEALAHFQQISRTSRHATNKEIASCHSVF